MLDKRRAVLAAMLALAAAGAAACGSDDDTGEGNANNAGQAQTGDGKAADGSPSSDDSRPVGGDKAQIRELMRKIQADYIAGNATAYCDALTAAGRRQVADAGKTLGLPADCEQFIAQTSKMTRDSDVVQKPTRILRIDVDGNHATATISDGGRPPEPLPFVKQGGEWKLPDPGLKKALEPDNNQSRPGQPPPQ